ncbi:carcinoembryonic antigen-related cell adhesion molecule 20-like isoform X2 [Brienomyrus brachyistius]|uniref:carcinoembryonic antigen-related cell adhesion molecule 20-like isoform X2 n=1 Tax=Brienomyrus brachyistius TaxID=42636 RepID=UPI0020B4359C|nr:carcinoembryonic antigen-related cell adhesion molecule 20-like isoform X2 [Brienomyrus brachyistius]
MDLKNLHFVFVFFAAIGCCAGQQPSLVNGIMGGTVTLRILNPPSPFPSILNAIWATSHGGQRVSVASSITGIVKFDPTYDSRAALNITTGSLQINKLTPKDSGTYDVTLIFTDGSMLTEQTVLKVYEPVAAVSVTANVTSAVEFNDTVSLTCSAQGSDLYFQWFNGSSQITPNDRVSLTNGNGTLTISSVRRYDQGPLICTVRNVFMSQSANITLDVSFGPENILVTATPQIKLQTTGSNVTLNCSAQSRPAASFSWAVNGTALKDVGPVYKLDNVAADKSGNYTCWAYNSKTQRYTASQTVQLTILEKISNTKIVGPSTPLIAGNSSANLTCQTKSGSLNTMEWLKDGKPLVPSSSVTVSADKMSLFISSVQRTDQGEYQCKVTNPVSTDTASYRMTVTYGPDKAHVEGVGAVEVGASVHLDCVVESAPGCNFSWTFNGTTKDVTSPKYVITSTAYSDTGIYACQARNVVTGMTAKSLPHMLAVKEKGTLPEPLSGGSIAGIIIGVLVAIILITIIAKCLMKRRKIESPY